jgi:hypothetical protein
MRSMESWKKVEVKVAPTQRALSANGAQSPLLGGRLVVIEFAVQQKLHRGCQGDASRLAPCIPRSRKTATMPSTAARRQLSVAYIPICRLMLWRGPGSSVRVAQTRGTYRPRRMLGCRSFRSTGAARRLLGGPRCAFCQESTRCPTSVPTIRARRLVSLDETPPFTARPPLRPAARR